MEKDTHEKGQIDRDRDGVVHVLVFPPLPGLDEVYSFAEAPSDAERAVRDKMIEARTRHEQAGTWG